ncbi:LysM peptidoglycan-binding domain-containing protein [Sporosarcina sp. A2]|uniref:LysM peptidoglycan-binding domain-containing protein n=1 Tax=Sporosarcina sp. A2 TaxID=3393449 RepID=UPI003D7A804D
MTKSDYNSEFEDNRKEIEVEEKKTEGLPSRVQLHQKKKASPKREKNDSRKGLTLINVILVLFTLIPIGIFVYVLSDLYNPKEDTTVSVDKSGVTIEVGSNEPPSSSSGTLADTEKNDGKSDEEASKEESQQEPQKPEKKPVETPTPKPEVKPEKKPEPKPEVKPEKKTEPKPEVKPEKKPEVKPEKKPEPKPEVKPVGKTHKVAPNETLYRISVNYYGSGSGVEKIKAANGLSTNSISVGQTLVIP